MKNSTLPPEMMCRDNEQLARPTSVPRLAYGTKVNDWSERGRCGVSNNTTKVALRSQEFWIRRDERWAEANASMR